MISTSCLISLVGGPADGLCIDWGGGADFLLAAHEPLGEGAVLRPAFTASPLATRRCSCLRPSLQAGGGNCAPAAVQASLQDRSHLLNSRIEQFAHCRHMLPAGRAVIWAFGINTALQQSTPKRSLAQRP